MGYGSYAGFADGFLVTLVISPLRESRAGSQATRGMSREAFNGIGYVIEGIEYAIQGVQYVIEDIECAIKGSKYVIDSIEYVVHEVQYVIKGILCVIQEFDYAIKDIQYVIQRVGYAMKGIGYATQRIEYVVEDVAYLAREVRRFDERNIGRDLDFDGLPDRNIVSEAPVRAPAGLDKVRTRA